MRLLSLWPGFLPHSVTLFFGALVITCPCHHTLLFVFYVLPLKCKLPGNSNFCLGVILPSTPTNKYITNESMHDIHYMLNNKSMNKRRIDVFSWVQSRKQWDRYLWNDKWNVPPESQILSLFIEFLSSRLNWSPIDTVVAKKRGLLESRHLASQGKSPV